MINFITAIILTELLTELIVKSYFFEPLRKFFFVRQEKNILLNKISYLLECGYCFSVWAAMFSVLLCIYTFDFEYLQYKHILNLLIGGLVVHRLSNVWHFIIDRLRG